MLRTVLSTAGKIILLVVVGVVLMIGVGRLIPLSEAVQLDAAQAQTAAQMVLAVQLVYAALFYAAAVQSDLFGWRLYLALFCVYYGFYVVMMQVESLIFIKALAPLTVSDVYRLMLTNLITIALYLVVVLFVARRWRSPVASDHRPIGSLVNRQLIWKIALIALIYPAVYFGFGRLVAWQFAAVREYYAATPIIYEQFTLTLIQVARGAAWAVFGLPIFLMFRRNARAIVYSALFYPILSGIVLLVPSVFMPPAVRLAHFLEIVSSMLLFGLIVGVIMVGWSRTARPVDASQLPAAGSHA
jgi:hypothetical protein